MPSQVFTLGGGVNDVITEGKSLVALATVASRYSTLETEVGTDYTVAAGKQFYVTKFRYQSTAASNAFHLGYGDDGVQNSAAAPTNFVQLTHDFLSLVSNVAILDNVFFIIPAGKLPAAFFTGTSTHILTLFGFEV